jgi:hypothetical protein
VYQFSKGDIEMKFRYSLETLYMNLYEVGIDDSPYACGYAKEEDDSHDGQECVLLNDTAFENNDEMVIVMWSDGETSEVSIMALIED